MPSGSASGDVSRLRSVARDQMQDRFEIPLRVESRRRQIGAQGFVIVNHSIVDQGRPPLRAEDGLTAAFGIDDRQPAMGEQRDDSIQTALSLTAYQGRDSTHTFDDPSLMKTRDRARRWASLPRHAPVSIWRADE
jgi:hypothetical protein